MEILYLLIPISVALVFLIAWFFLWAVKSGQFDDMEGPAHRILMDDDRAQTQPSPDEHGNGISPNDKTRHARFPLPGPLIEQLAIRLSSKAAKSLVIPQAGEGDEESLRETHVKADAPVE